MALLACAVDRASSALHAMTMKSLESHTSSSLDESLTQAHPEPLGRSGRDAVIAPPSREGERQPKKAELAAHKAITRALRLLPRQPDEIAVVERGEVCRARSGTAPVEACVNHGSRVVYLVKQGATLQATLKGPGIFDYVLAAVIWHEMAHIDGADEESAQKAEERLWMEFIVSQRVDRDRGLRYLALLIRRPASAPQAPIEGDEHVHRSTAQAQERPPTSRLRR
jgi:hypothetical protein